MKGVLPEGEHMPFPCSSDTVRQAGVEQIRCLGLVREASLRTAGQGAPECWQRNLPDSRLSWSCVLVWKVVRGVEEVAGFL